MDARPDTHSDSARPPRHGSQHRPAFTLIELLVVVAIMALLMAIVIPSLRNARDSAKVTKCMANLHAVGVGLVTYAQEYNGQLPGYAMMGKHGFRIRPGNRIRIPLPGGGGTQTPFSEAWGIQGILATGTSPTILPNGVAVYNRPGRTRYLPAESKVWICPGNPGPTDRADWPEWGNTYAYRCNSSGQNDPRQAARIYSLDWLGKDGGFKNPLVWDNYINYPGIPGFNGPFNRWTIDETFRQPPHRKANVRGGPSEFWIAFYVAGHCEMNGMNKN